MMAKVRRSLGQGPSFFAPRFGFPPFLNCSIRAVRLFLVLLGSWVTVFEGSEQPALAIDPAMMLKTRIRRGPEEVQKRIGFFT